MIAAPDTVAASPLARPPLRASGLVPASRVGVLIDLLTGARRDFSRAEGARRDARTETRVPSTSPHVVASIAGDLLATHATRPAVPAAGRVIEQPR